jgi:hypothetical protein
VAESRQKTYLKYELVNITKQTRVKAIKNNYYSDSTTVTDLKNGYKRKIKDLGFDRTAKDGDEWRLLKLQRGSQVMLNVLRKQYHILRMKSYG